MLYISPGNIKVKCAIFNLPRIITCKPDLECHKFCYASKAERQYPSCLPCRLRNLEISKGDTFTQDICTFLKDYKGKYFRLHESGDFYCIEYVYKWYEIAKLNPQIVFFTFTKRDDIFTEQVLSKKPKNLTLNLSIDGIDKAIDSQPLRKLGWNNVARISKTLTNCPAMKDKSLKCITNCTKCARSNKKDIVFKKH